ncbi:MAG: hypothetical protein QOH96_1697 [Blastocatellia bacterium]|nr:hypothetical protein [Blastocatellia bacterium]
MKTWSINLHSELLWAAVFLLLILPILVIGTYRKPEDNKRSEELTQLTAEIPVYPGFREIRSSEFAKEKVAIVSVFYLGTGSNEEVKSFYIRELIERGWRQPQETDLSPNLTEDGWRLTFRKNRNGIIVEKNTDHKDWNFSIDFTFEL